MSKEQATNLTTDMVIGGITAVGIGAFLLELMSAAALALVGLIVAYLFNTLARPRLDKLFKKKS